MRIALAWCLMAVLVAILGVMPEAFAQVLENAPRPAQSGNGFLQPLGPIAEDQRAHLFRVIAITSIAILPVIIGVPLIIWRYRYRPDGERGGEYKPYWDFSWPLEFVLWGVPIVIVSVLSFWLWHSTIRLDPYKAVGPDPLVVRAIGYEWKWLFLYPDEDVASVGELVIPVDRPVRIELTTDGVMQSFFIPALAGQIYAMPGMTTQLNLIADRAGAAIGENTQFNGSGFGKQKFTVRAVPEAQWTGWVGAAASARELDSRTLALIAKRSTLAELRSDLGLNDAANVESLVLRSTSDTIFQEMLGRYSPGHGHMSTHGTKAGEPTFGAGHQHTAEGTSHDG